MAKKKATKKKNSKGPSWDEIGKSIGQKIDHEIKDGKCDSKWMKWNCGTCDGGGFVGRLVFIIGVLIALNTLGYLEGVSGWILFLIGFGFALMKF